MYSAEGYFYVRWHLVLFARVLGSLLVHMSPLFAARPGMHLTAVVSTNVENAAILTAASVLPPREQGSIKRARVALDGSRFTMMTTADCVAKWLGSPLDGTDLNSDIARFFFIPPLRPEDRSTSATGLGSSFPPQWRTCMWHLYLRRQYRSYL